MSVVHLFSSLGDLTGRCLFAIVVVMAASQRRLLRAFIVPAIAVIPVAFLYAAATGVTARSLWPGGSGRAGSRLMQANYAGLRDNIIGAGDIRAEEIDADVARLEDPQFLALSPMMWSRVPELA